MDDLRHRITLFKDGNRGSGPVIYWMSRDQRVHDNYALLYAGQLARQHHKPLGVVFNLVMDFHEAGIRQYDFMLKGLKEVEKELRNYNIPFFLLSGDPENEIPLFIAMHGVSELVTDFDPLK